MTSEHPYPMRASDCSEMESWDIDMSMCMPLASPDMPMRMLMLSGNIFGGYTAESGPRGRDAWWSTSVVMVDGGTALGERHYLNLDLMLTAERWTSPVSGFPLLLQIGEEDAQGNPYRDAQHPHSSPIMGITLSDTIRLGDAQNSTLKFYFAPRGESTDGPIAFMHRPTGMINPDAPLGHHIGQDVGHISSTVVGGSLRLGGTRLEASAFHGEEPSPTKVNLPIGTPDSVAFRVIQDLSSTTTAMASFAYVADPEPEDASISEVTRWSASLYQRWEPFPNWTLDSALIYGAISHYDHVTLLNSFTGEFWLHSGHPNLWGRIEVLERTANELGTGGADPDSPSWVAAATVGYTHVLVEKEGESLGLGASVTKDLLPAVFSPAYGGNPWSGKVFLELKGMRMWDL
jgi:hypothetical protein